MKLSKITAVGLVLLLSASAAFAQGGWGSLSALKGQRKVNVAFDYSESIIQGRTEEKWASEEPNWGLAQEEVAAKFVEEFNERVASTSSPILVGEFPDAYYTILIKPSNIVRKGNFSGRVYLMDGNGNIVMDVPLQAKGGHIGSFWNLLGDGMRDAAKTIAYKYRDIVK